MIELKTDSLPCWQCQGCRQADGSYNPDTCEKGKTECSEWVEWFRQTWRALRLRYNVSGIATGEQCDEACAYWYKRGYIDVQVDQMAGYPDGTCRNWRRRNKAPANLLRFDVYGATGELLASGTAKACAQQLGISESIFRNLCSRCKDGVVPKYRIFKNGKDVKTS